MSTAFFLLESPRGGGHSFHNFYPLKLRNAQKRELDEKLIYLIQQAGTTSPKKET